MVCPNCGSRLVGRIGNQQYYCRNCFVEFVQRAGEWRVFKLDAEGALFPAGRGVAGGERGACGGPYQEPCHQTNGKA